MKPVFGDECFFLASLNPNDSAPQRNRDFAFKQSLQFGTIRWIFAEVADGRARRSRFVSLAADFLTRCHCHPSLRALPLNEEQARFVPLFAE